MSFAPKPVYSARRVVSVPYFVDPDGDGMRPDIPTQCPSGEDDVACRLHRHRSRRRKCGLRHKLAGFRCLVHDCTFTAYPPSWKPFGRRPIAEVAPDGSDVDGLEPGVEAWRDTAFGAAVDAAAQRPWPLTAGGIIKWRERFGVEPYGVRRTQLRHLEGSRRLFALDPDQTTEHPRVASTIQADLTDIVSASHRVRDGPGMVACGEGIVGLLSTLGHPGRRMLTGFDRLGVARGYWGPPTKNDKTT